MSCMSGLSNIFDDLSGVIMLLSLQKWPRNGKLISPIIQVSLCSCWVKQWSPPHYLSVSAILVWVERCELCELQHATENTAEMFSLWPTLQTLLHHHSPQQSSDQRNTFVKIDIIHGIGEEMINFIKPDLHLLSNNSPNLRIENRNLK